MGFYLMKEKNIRSLFVMNEENIQSYSVKLSVLKLKLEFSAR